MKQDKPFEMPEQVLHTLNEVTLGFVLCYVDANGNPQIASQADNHSFFLSMQSTLRSWIEAHDMVSRDMNVLEITSGGCGDPECPNCGTESEED